uniref:Uncharacterized protein n=1 Tax=Arundo donax TaxID=35708 RepID=A0A0A9C1C2_ARUDO
MLRVWWNRWCCVDVSRSLV